MTDKKPSKASTPAKPTSPAKPGPSKDSKQTAGLTVKRSEDFSAWYNEVVIKAGLADHTDISGCMVIKPWGYALWEAIQGWLDSRFKATGHRNAYFPLFIPERELKREAEHFAGFTPEVAWVERHEGDSERYALRPTSETIIYSIIKPWVRSWRDLPLLLNQWCNIVRWEVKATRLFLRTREFLWQEGHTVHATNEEAEQEVMQQLALYKELAESVLAVPVISGRKSEREKFAGAATTTTIESLMPDGKALQLGTSHNLGQHFTKAFDLKFTDKDEKERHPWSTSWGVSTRLLGAVVMAHGDDRGLVLPPAIAPYQAVIVPIVFDKEKESILAAAKKLGSALASTARVHVDDRDAYSAGWKFNEWELRGVPVRIELGPKDLAAKQAVLVRRDTGEKTIAKQSELPAALQRLLAAIQRDLLAAARKRMDAATTAVKTFAEFQKAIEARKLVLADWCAKPDCEDALKEATAASSRAIPFEQPKPGSCFRCGEKASVRAYFARAY
ncbi:MAG TPA: proline--tRNA ligase [archaeon]|nr:proline--tRNA ligase [archaeon]